MNDPSVVITLNWYIGRIGDWSEAPFTLIDNDVANDKFDLCSQRPQQLQ